MQDAAQTTTIDRSQASAVLILDGVAHAIPRHLALRVLEVAELAAKVEP